MGSILIQTLPRIKLIKGESETGLRIFLAKTDFCGFSLIKKNGIEIILQNRKECNNSISEIYKVLIHVSVVGI